MPVADNLGDLPALAEAEPVSRLGPLGFDPDREQLIQRVIMAISSASVPHEHWIPGALSSRSLGYYLGVGIDHFGHDYARHETLLRKAAEQAIAAIAMEARQGGDAFRVREDLTGHHSMGRLHPKDDSAVAKPIAQTSSGKDSHAK